MNLLLLFCLMPLGVVAMLLIIAVVTPKSRPKRRLRSYAPVKHKPNPPGVGDMGGTGISGGLDGDLNTPF